MNHYSHLNSYALPLPENLRDEFTVQSAIHPDLYQLNCKIIHDVEIENGEPTTPIHDALNWDKMTRFTNEARKMIAVEIRDHRGKVYQVKVYTEKPSKNGKTGQYYAPKPLKESVKGDNDKFFRAKVPRWFCVQVATKYGLEAPSPENFWSWVEQNPMIEIIITEGVKKTLAAITAGYVCIGFYGCRCGYDPITRLVRKDLLGISLNRSRVTIAFDRDTKPSAIKAVTEGIRKLAPALIRSGVVKVDVATWNPSSGKGIDDLIKNNPTLFEQAINNATPVSAYEAFKEKTNLIEFSPTYIHQRYFPKNLNIPTTAKIICLKGKKKTGKTSAICDYIKQAQAQGQPCFVVAHRIALARNLCVRFGLNHLTDITELKTLEGKLLGYGLCIDSLRPSSSANFNPSEMCNAIVIFDEADEVLHHTLLGNTITQNGQRVEILLNLEEGIRNCLSSDEGKLFLMSADLSPKEINFFKALSGNEPEVFVIENTFKPIEGKRKAFIYNSAAHFNTALNKAIARGEKVLVHLSSQQAKYKWSTTTTESKLRKKFPHLLILRIDADSISDKDHPAFGCMEHLDRILAQYDVVLASPTIETGISIDLQDHFDSVWVIANGTQGVNAACQTPERLRADVPRHLFIARTSNQRIGNGSIYAKGMLDWKNKRQAFNVQSLKEAATAQTFSSVGNLFTDTWADYASEYNFGMVNYRDICLGKLKDEGYEIIEVGGADKKEQKAEIQVAKTTSFELYHQHCTEVANTSNPVDCEYERLQRQITMTLDEKNQLEHGFICRLYITPNVTPELVRAHENGLFNHLDLLYSLFEGRPYLLPREIERLEKLIYKGKFFEPDVIKVLKQVKIATLEKILLPLLNHLLQGEVVDKTNLVDWFNDIILPYRKDINDYLGLNISGNPSRNTSIRTLQILLKLVGLDLIKLKKRKGQVWQYQLNLATLEKYQPFRDRWYQRDSSKYLQKEQTSSDCVTELVLECESNNIQTPSNHITQIPQSQEEAVNPIIDQTSPVLGKNVSDCVPELVSCDSNNIQTPSNHITQLPIEIPKKLIPPLDSTVELVRDILVGVDYTNREDVRTFEWIVKDYGPSTIEAALPHLEDEQQSSTLTQWLKEIQTGFKLGSKVLFLGLEHVLLYFKGKYEAVVKIIGTREEFIVDVRQLKTKYS